MDLFHQLENYLSQFKLIDKQKTILLLFRQVKILDLEANSLDNLAKKRVLANLHQKVVYKKRAQLLELKKIQEDIRVLRL